MNKTILIWFFFITSLGVYAQALTISPGKGIGEKITSDTMVATRIINSTIQGPSNTYAISFITGLAQLQNLQTTQLSVAQGNFSQTLSASSISAGNLSAQSFQIGSVTEATPIFGNSEGQLVRSSPLLHFSINSAGFTPDRISPLENASILKFNGQIRSFQEGEAEMSALSNSTYRLIAPLSLGLNQSSANIRILSMKICVLDNDNSLDLVGIVHEVKDSQNSTTLSTIPKLGVRSADHINQYRCFDDIKSTHGTDFLFDQAQNSYYVSVFPIARTLPTNDIFKASPAPVTLDNPGLRLVHITFRYVYE